MAVTPGHTQLNGFAEVWSPLAPEKLLLSITGALLALRTHMGWQQQKHRAADTQLGIPISLLWRRGS